MEHRYVSPVAVSHLILRLLCIYFQRLDPLSKLANLLIYMTQILFEILLQYFQRLVLRYLQFLTSIECKVHRKFGVLAKSESD